MCAGHKSRTPNNLFSEDTGSNVLRLALTVFLLGSTSAQNTTLDEQFCQVYYNLDDGNCETLRNAVRSEIRGSGTPTLELGDPSGKPVLVFFHGWPDTNAMWANQFAAFCGEDGEFACVAPSMMDYNPDVAPADPASLSWPLQADVLHEVITDMGLEDITLVTHDFGSIVGYMYVARHPGIVQRFIAMDVGSGPGNPNPPNASGLPGLMSFQQGAIGAFLTMNDTAMHGLMQGMAAAFGAMAPPCHSCKIAPNTEMGIGYKVGWMHRNWINEDPAWTSFFDMPYSDFEFTYTPTWPDDVPQLFLYASESFHAPSYRTWLDGRGDGSGHLMIPQNGDHWFMCRGTVSETNEAMAAFFEGRLSPSPTTTTSTSADFATTQSSRANDLPNSMILAKVVCALSAAKIFF